MKFFAIYISVLIFFLLLGVDCSQQQGNFDDSYADNFLSQPPLEDSSSFLMKMNKDLKISKIQPPQKKNETKIIIKPKESPTKIDKIPNKNNETNRKTGKKDPYETLSLLLSNYMQNSQRKTEKTRDYSWQMSLNYIQPLYIRSFVQKIISSRPISHWPAVIRTLVFPQIYGYYSINTLKPELFKLYKSFVKEKVNNEEDFKLDLLEKLMKFEELKRFIEGLLLDQTEKLIEGKKYGERIEHLTNYLKEQESKISKVDEILQEVAEK